MSEARQPPPSVPAPVPDEHEASPWVIRADTLRAHADAAAIRDGAQLDARRVRDVAAADAARIRADAVAALERAVADRVAERLRIFEADLLAWRAAREAELLPLAFAVAARIVGTLPADHALELAARTALAEHAGTAGLTLRTDPATAAMLRERLGDAAVLIRADENSGPGDCVLEHPRGQAVVSPAAQLAALEEAATGASRGTAAA